MLKFKTPLLAATVALGACIGCANAASVQITEWTYDNTGTSGEFVEFTNLSNAPVDMSTWSFSDSARTPGAIGLVSFGTVNSGESVILTQASAATFRSEWGLAGTVKVISYGSGLLQRSDELNLYNGTSLIDRLTFDDANGQGPRTNGKSARPSNFAAIGANNANLWTLSVVGDVEGSYKAPGGTGSSTIGSPGKTSFAPPVPLPAAAYLLLSGLGVLGAAVKRKRSVAA